MIGGIIDRHSITRKRAPRKPDGRGNETWDWANAALTELHGWAVDAGQTGEDTANRDGASVVYTLRGPIESDVLATDRVVLFGDEYVVNGVVRQPGVTALTSHVIVTLIAWKG